MQKYPITTTGFITIKKNLYTLKVKVRPEIIKSIETAREHGDLSENAEYDAAKEKQGFVEAQIRNLEEKIMHSQVIDVRKLSGEKVLFGATVTIYNYENKLKETWQIVGEEETDLIRRKINIKAPISKALIGKKIGDQAEIITPRGNKKCKIINIEFI